MLQRMLESFNLCNFPFAKAMHNINVTIIRWAAHAGRGRHPVRQPQPMYLRYTSCR